MGKIFRFSDFGMHFRAKKVTFSHFSRWVAFFPHFWGIKVVNFGKHRWIYHEMGQKWGQKTAMGKS